MLLDIVQFILSSRHRVLTAHAPRREVTVVVHYEQRTHV